MMQLTEDTLQRLVDGELSAAEYQDALLALEADPSTCETNLWRRCALAFLESQAFELGAKSWLETRQRGEMLSDSTSQPALVTKAPNVLAWALLLTVAASLAGAFWVGGLMGDLSRSKGNGPLLGGAPSTVNAPNVFDENADGSIFVSIPVDSEGEFDSAAWVNGAPTPLPPDIQRKWEEEGYTVRARRRLIPVVIPNGRTIIAPFEQYEKVPRTDAALQ
jgi:hypothetical protein